MADCCPRSARRVVTVYDMIHERFPDSFSPRDRGKQIKAHAVQRADHVICISENTRRDLIETLGIPEEKTSVCYLGCSLSTRIAQNATQKRSPYILYVGHRGGYKNFETLLRAYGHSTLLKSEFRLVCFGGGAFTSREKAMIEELGILPTSIKQVSGNDDVLAGLYNTASVFVYPSLYEGFGIPPLEAMSFDCPVVCSNAGSLPEVVGNAAEMCDPRNEENIRQAIVKVVTSSDLSRDLVSRGRLRVKIFSWERCAMETLATYKMILQT